jgi:hypothetical protein
MYASARSVLKKERMIGEGNQTSPEPLPVFHP